ncbi:hypothetical protein HPB49_009877 [Dermacentor silvarum]|uniref:Uncharacterized protein n=1 Tax=Dermacentor silvarum TaxID=543639 RepID=A0ACB8C8R5_DERSI|nr:hypothetical protein HPB49_009877 [Dermacentor silvarum]
MESWDPTSNRIPGSPYRVKNETRLSVFPRDRLLHLRADRAHFKVDRADKDSMADLGPNLEEVVHLHVLLMASSVLRPRCADVFSHGAPLSDLCFGFSSTPVPDSCTPYDSPSGPELPDTSGVTLIGALSDRDAASVPITEQTNDSPPGEDMDEDTTPLAIDTDTIEDEAYNGACWKVVRNKRRARNAAAYETASLRQNASEHPSAEPKQSGPKRLPPLPLRDEKVILRPLGGLRLDKWPRPTLATALWTAAGVSPNDRRDLILRTRPEQNLAIVSTPSSHVADALLNIQELSISQRTYPVSAYLAAPDDSCKGIVPGLEPGTSSHMLVEEMQASGIQILQARMMGQTNIALVTFEGLRVPRFVRFLGAELRCYPHRPRQPVCKTCLKLGHRADHCPTPDVTICEQCGIENPIPSHPCSPRCKSCGGDHPTTEPKCPQRQRQPFNRAWVKKAIEDEQRQLKASTNADPPSATTPASGTSFKKAGRSRSKTPSRSRPKARVNSKSRSRSRSQSSSARNQVKRQTTPASQASPQPYKKALLNKLATSAATPDRQQAQAPENTNAKAAPREPCLRSHSDSREKEDFQGTVAGADVPVNSGDRLDHLWADRARFLEGRAHFQVDRGDKDSLGDPGSDPEEVVHFHVLVAARAVAVVCVVLVSAAYPNKYNASEHPAHRYIDLCSRRHSDSRAEEDFHGLVVGADVVVTCAVLVSAVFPNKCSASEPPVHQSIDNVFCRPGQRCVFEKVVCVRSPCPPIPQCV